MSFEEAINRQREPHEYPNTMYMWVGPKGKEILDKMLDIEAQHIMREQLKKPGPGLLQQLKEPLQPFNGKLTRQDMLDLIEGLNQWIERSKNIN